MKSRWIRASIFLVFSIVAVFVLPKVLDKSYYLDIAQLSCIMCGGLLGYYIGDNVK